MDRVNVSWDTQGGLRAKGTSGWGLGVWVGVGLRAGTGREEGPVTDEWRQG